MAGVGRRVCIIRNTNLDRTADPRRVRVRKQNTNRSACPHFLIRALRKETQHGDIDSFDARSMIRPKHFLSEVSFKVENSILRRYGERKRIWFGLGLASSLYCMSDTCLAIWLSPASISFQLREKPHCCPPCATLSAFAYARRLPHYHRFQILGPSYLVFFRT